VSERQYDLERDGHQGTPCAKPSVGSNPMHSVAPAASGWEIGGSGHGRREIPSSHCRLPVLQVSMARGPRGAMPAGRLPAAPSCRCPPAR
jgi:hypothetical protein